MGDGTGEAPSGKVSMSLGLGKPKKAPLQPAAAGFGDKPSRDEVDERPKAEFVSEMVDGSVDGEKETTIR